MTKKRNFLPVVMTALTLFGGMETLASDGSVDAVKKVFKEGNYIDIASPWRPVRGSDIPAFAVQAKTDENQPDFPPESLLLTQPTNISVKRHT